MSPHIDRRHLPRPTRCLRSPTAVALMTVLAGLVFASGAPAQTPPPEEESTPQLPRLLTDEGVDGKLAKVLTEGIPVRCADLSFATGWPYDCRISLTVRIPRGSARYLGLSSRIVAKGVASHPVENYKVRGENVGRVYFLPLRASAKARIKAKHVRSMRVLTNGTSSVPGHDRVYCMSVEHPIKPTRSTPTPPSCPFTDSSSADFAKRSSTWAAAAGAHQCFPVEDFFIGVPTTPSPYGPTCPPRRPIKAG